MSPPISTLLFCRRLDSCYRAHANISPGYPRQRTLADIENAFFGIFDNFPSTALSLAMRGVAFPTGRCYKPPSDSLTQEVAQLVSTDSAVRGDALLAVSIDGFDERFSCYLRALCFPQPKAFLASIL